MFTSKKLNWMFMLVLVALSVLAGHFGWVAHDAALGFVGVGAIMSGQGVRVIDPILSTVAQGYRNAEFIGDTLFPRVPVYASGGQIIEFGKEAFLNYNLRRTPGAATKRIQFGYLGKPFALLQDSVEVPVPREFMRDAAAVPGIDLGTRSVALGMKIVTKSLEMDQAAIATNAANYDVNHQLILAGASKWSAAGSTPSVDIANAREQIRGSVGIYPNTVVLSAKAFQAAINNPSVVGRFQYTTHDVITEQMLAALWNVDKVVVGKAISMTDGGVASDIWGNNVILAYTNLGSQNAEEPSFGYTYTMDGNPLVEQPYWDAATKSWVYPVNFERVPVLSGITSAFLIQNPA